MSIKYRIFKLRENAARSGCASPSRRNLKRYPESQPRPRNEKVWGWGPGDSVERQGSGTTCCKPFILLCPLHMLRHMETFLQLDIESPSITMLFNTKAILPSRNVNLIFFFFTSYLLQIVRVFTERGVCS